MKNIVSTIFSFAAIGLLFTSCERDFSDDVEFASFPATPDIFTDVPVGLTDQFFISFDPNDGANAEGFGTDDNVAFEGSSSIRIDVPAPDDPNGGFIGGIFLDRGAGRDLTEFDALTFYVKGSTTATLDEVGFGTDFGPNKFAVTRQNIRLSTDWRKVVVPIPDASRLVQERGMFSFAAGTQSTNGVGFTFWIDELRFEKTGTIAQPRPAIQNGNDISQPGFVNISQQVTGLTQTFNTETGENVTVNVQPSYFNFSSSNPSVARVDELGQVSVVGLGEASITASIAGVPASGSLNLNVGDTFEFAPTPPARASEDVISVFSEAYDNVPVDYFNGFFTPDGQTTQGGAPPLDFNGDRIINYTELNFVGIGTFLNVAPINATEMTTFHVDVKVNEEIGSGDFIRLQLLNSVGNGETSGSITLNASDLVQDEWVSFDIPLTDFTGLSDRSQIGLLFFVSDSTISDIFVDNIYYYR